MTFEISSNVIFHPWASNPLWHDKPLLQRIEFLPFIAAGIWCFLKGRQHWPARFPTARSISVIILTENETQDISGCSLSFDIKDCPIEIIRGTQITICINAAQNDVIVLLQAEAWLLADIELSLRMKENGATVFVPSGVAGTSCY